MKCGDCRWYQALPTSTEGDAGLCALYTSANVMAALAYSPDDEHLASWTFAWENRDWCKVWEPKPERG